MDGRSPDTLKCSFCREPFPDSRKLAVHEERHKPVLGPKKDPKTGQVVSIVCAGGCGRHFLSWAQYRDHAPLCDGLPPLSRETMEDEPEALTVTCPECKEDYPSPEKLSVHLVRHEEVSRPTYEPRTGELMSRPCPRDCGRHFLSKKDYRDHVTLCDGATPIPPGKREKKVRREPDRKEEKMLKCEDCGKTFEKNAALGSHRFRAHGVRSKGSPKKKAGRIGTRRSAPARAVRELVRETSGETDIIDRLKELAQEHREKADKLDNVIQQLEEGSLL